MECLACCVHLVSDEYVCPNHHQSLCLPCLLQWVETKPTCPVCREEYEIVPTPNDAWGGLLNMLQPQQVTHYINEEASNNALERLALQLTQLSESIYQIILHNPAGFQLNLEGAFYQIQVNGGVWNYGRSDDGDDRDDDGDDDDVDDDGDEGDRDDDDRDSEILTDEDDDLSLILGRL